MNLPGYYSSGQFAKMAGVSLRTIRYYDKQNILKPSYVNESGARFYTEEDFAHLQQILLLKYLGFSLDDIKELALDTTDYQYMLNSLRLQKKLVQDRMEQMQLVETAIEDTISTIEQNRQIDWSNMLDLIHLTGMEKSLKTQYQNAGNISARIRLHRDYSVNPVSWFTWMFEQYEVKPGMKIFELGCGDGALWTENMDKLPAGVQVVVSDKSEGMLRDAKRAISAFVDDDEGIFTFKSIDCQEIPYPEDSFDLIIANHVLFYCEDIAMACKEIERVLAPGGRFICSTYGSHHMKEITHLVQGFDNRIVLAAENLYDRFGLENGEGILKTAFSNVTLRRYEDAIEIKTAEPLLDYILSCHGNQNQILLDKYKEFKNYVTEKTRYGFHITKDAGIFIAQKQK